MLTRSEIASLEAWLASNFGLPPRVDFTDPVHRLAMGQALDRTMQIMPELLRVYSAWLEITPDRSPPVMMPEVASSFREACLALEELGTLFEDARPANLIAPEDETHEVLRLRIVAWQVFGRKFEKEIQKYPTLQQDDLIERLEV